jgi:hypothetical protein
MTMIRSTPLDFSFDMMALRGCVGRHKAIVGCESALRVHLLAGIIAVKHHSRILLCVWDKTATSAPEVGTVLFDRNREVAPGC